MKKTIPFELFEENQFILFDILRLAELEKSLGMPITEVVRRQDAGVNFCLTALPIGMKQHYHKPSPAFFAEKIEAHLETGGSLDEIAVPIIKAIVASGVFGKIKFEEDQVEEDVEQKNVVKGKTK